MAKITETIATKRLTRKLQRNGITCWIGKTDGDAWGKYLVFSVSPCQCIGGAGWTLAEASAKVDQMISDASLIRETGKATV